MSVIVVTKTVEATAGSILYLSNNVGIIMPDNPAKIILMIIDTPIKIESLKS